MCSGRAWAVCTPFATSAPRRCCGSRRSHHSRPKRMRSASWRNGRPKHGSWRGRGMTTTTQAASRTRPYTGAEYLESLRDGREIWIYGEKVKDVTTHPAFRNTARMLARLYDALHDPALQDVLTTETDTGSGSRTHKYFKAPKSGEEQLAARDAIAAW